MAAYESKSAIRVSRKNKKNQMITMKILTDLGK